MGIKVAMTSSGGSLLKTKYVDTFYSVAMTEMSDTAVGGKRDYIHLRNVQDLKNVFFF